ncbi:MAG: c-type cytochrome [Elusimicrobia bacterium]|nr:c-type cytochrome [Elusimicrobiota bacterium]
MNKAGLKIGGFVLLIIGVFILIGNSIPQIRSDPPRSLNQEDFQKLSLEERIAKGKGIFGTGGERCSQCHIVASGTPGRCPDLEGMSPRAEARAKERSAQTGKRYSGEEYLLESLIEPAAYLVKGYSPLMPEVYKPPLDLSEYDIRAVVTYLESLGGQPALSKTELKPEWTKAITEAKSSSKEAIRGDIGNGKNIFLNRMRCVACHQISVDGNKVGGILGPDLSRVGDIRGQDSLRSIIINPPGDIMPKHFKENLTEQELNDLVVFLMSLRG